MGYYDSWCYLPVAGFVSFDDEPDQYLFTTVLRPGNAPDKRGALAILERILRRLRVAFPRARFRVRLDAGFASHEIFAFLEDQADVDYAVAMPKNSVLLRRIKKLMRKARRLSRESGQTAHVYAECRYAAIKIGAHVVESVRRVVLHLLASYPFLDPWRQVALSLGATTG